MCDQNNKCCQAHQGSRCEPQNSNVMLQSILRRAAQVSAKNAKVAAARPLVGMLRASPAQGSRFNFVAASRAASSKVNHDSPDDAFTATRYPAGDAESKRAFTYFVLGSARFLYASAARVIVIRALAHMSASADVLALASLEVDLAKVDPGTTITVKWRGKPVFIRNRTEEQIAKAVAVPMSELKDPEPDADRAIDPQW